MHVLLSFPITTIIHIPTLKLQISIGACIPAVRAKPTSTRSGQLEWWRTVIKAPSDENVPNDQLSIVLAYNGSDTRGHYFPCCKLFFNLSVIL